MGWWRSRWWSKWWWGTCSTWSPTCCSHRSASSDPCSCGGGCLFSSWLLWVGSAAGRNCHLILTFWLIRKSPAWMALCGWPWGEICAPWSLATRAKHILPGEYLCQEYLDRQFFILYPMGQFYIHLWMSSHCKARPFALSAMPQGQQIRHIDVTGKNYFTRKCIRLMSKIKFARPPPHYGQYLWIFVCV